MIHIPSIIIIILEDIIIRIVIENAISMSIIIIIKAIILMAAMTKNILTQVKTTFLGLGAILQLSKHQLSKQCNNV